MFGLGKKKKGPFEVAQRVHDSILMLAVSDSYMTGTDSVAVTAEGVSTLVVASPGGSSPMTPMVNSGSLDEREYGALYAQATPKNVRKAMEDIGKYLPQLKNIMSDEVTYSSTGTPSPSIADSPQSSPRGAPGSGSASSSAAGGLPDGNGRLSNLPLDSVMLCDIVSNIHRLSFEFRKDVVAVFSATVRHVPSILQMKPNEFPIMGVLVRGYESVDVALHCGLMLRDAIKYSELCARFLLEREDLLEKLLAYVSLSNFDVASDAFATLKDLLTKHKALVSEFLLSHFDTFFGMYNRLLSSENYVTRRQSLKLLSELLLDRSNFQVMTQYIALADNLKLAMTLLKDKSKIIQFEAFHVFKIFVANPKKPQEVKNILFKNQDRLVSFLQGFQTEKDKDDEQFLEEKNLLIREIQSLASLGSE